jgi:hypothetical protein
MPIGFLVHLDWLAAPCWTDTMIGEPQRPRSTESAAHFHLTGR